MSEKELLYIDDALGHFENVNDYLKNNIENLTDENFKSVLKEFDKENKEVYKKLYKLNK